ncbi:MAG: RecX family transcriptional regulator [Patescibacteria group bacterium]
MKITKLSPQQKTADRYNLDVDGEFYCGLDEVLITELNLYVDKVINADDLKKIKEFDDYQKCLNKAFSLLSIRMNSESELKKKLKKRFEYKTVNKVIIRLKELNYINDQTFVKNWIENRGSNRGRFLLKKELMQKGIDKSLVDKYFEQIDPDLELAHARELVAKKHWPEMTEDEEYQKIGGFLSRRGFDYETIRRVNNENK